MSQDVGIRGGTRVFYLGCAVRFNIPTVAKSLATNDDNNMCSFRGIFNIKIY